MAKVPYSKLKLSKSEIVKIQVGENEIEVKTYLPIDETVEMLNNLINHCANNEQRFYNPLQVETLFIFNVIKYYTNISFTEKQSENIVKLVDSFVESGEWEKIKTAIGKDLEVKHNDIIQVLKATEDYQNSIYGILDNINKDYADLDKQASEVEQKLGNEDNLKFMKELLNKMA